MSECKPYFPDYKKDLKLYTDMAKALQDNRIFYLSKRDKEIDTYKKLVHEHERILNRLAKRLNIATLDKFVFEKKKEVYKNNGIKY